jgi:hypothetical protein
VSRLLGSLPKSSSFWKVPSPVDQLHFLLVALVLIVAPNFALGFADTALQPYEHTGWAWRLLVSLPVAAVLVALGGAIAWLAFTRSSVRALSTLCIVYAMPVHAFELVGYVNVAADHAPDRLVTVACVRRIVRHKGPSTDEVTFWDNPSRTIELRTLALNEADCNAHRRVEIHVHPGFLGAEWVSQTR